MGSFRFDWRWVGIIAIIAVMAGARNLPWPVVALTTGAGGGYLLYYGWQIWTRYGGRPSRNRTTYWRGQRYEVGPSRAGPALPRWDGIGPAAGYLFFGSVLVIVALAVVLQQFGR